MECGLSWVRLTVVGVRPTGKFRTPRYFNYLAAAVTRTQSPSLSYSSLIMTKQMTINPVISEGLNGENGIRNRGG